jgi:hypothetical protein
MCALVFEKPFFFYTLFPWIFPRGKIGGYTASHYFLGFFHVEKLEDIQHHTISLDFSTWKNWRIYSRKNSGVERSKIIPGCLLSTHLFIIFFSSKMADLPKEFLDELEKVKSLGIDTLKALALDSLQWKEMLHFYRPLKRLPLFLL